MSNTAESFENRHVLLTGVGRAGQAGEVIAREFADRGAHVMLVAHDAANARDRARDLTDAGFRATGFACDLTDESEVMRLTQSVGEICGDHGLSALVNAAGGFAMSGNVASSSLEVWQRMLSINLMTAYMTTRAMLPVLRKGRGAIVYFATGAALPGQKVAGMSAYAIAKGAVITLARAVSQEESSVRANVVAPTAIRTATNLESMGSDAKYVEREEVARTVAFLCSSAASAISGQVIRLA